MEDTVGFIGVIAIGAALGVPLLYGVSTLLGLTHKQFRPILRRKQRDGMAVLLVNGSAEPPVEQGEPAREQQRRRQ